MADQLIEPFHVLHLAVAKFRFPALSVFGIMDGEPDCRVIFGSPFDTVFYARWNENVVAWGQNPDLGLAFETQSRRSGQDHNPFGPGLFVPKPRRTRLAQGDDPLDLQIGDIENTSDDFLTHIALRPLE